MIDRPAAGRFCLGQISETVERWRNSPLRPVRRCGSAGRNPDLQSSRAPRPPQRLARAFGRLVPIAENSEAVD